MIQGATEDTVACEDELTERGAATGTHLPSSGELARRYGEEIRRVALRVTQSETAAQDVMQEVFVRIILTGGFDASRGSLERWLQIVTQNTAIDWIRRETAHQQRSIRVGAIHSATTIVVEEAVTARGEAAHVRAAVAQLPECERVVVSLAFFGGLSYRQVARQLGLAEGTVKSQIRRALTRLSHIIGPDAIING